MKTKILILVSVLLALALSAAVAVFAFAEDDGTQVVAKIGSTEYTDFEEALTAANDNGSVLTLQTDVTLPAVFSVTGTLKLNLAGHKLYAGGTTVFSVKGGSTLYLWSSAAGGQIDVSGALIALSEAANTTSAKCYVGAYAGTTSVTTSYREYLTVNCYSVIFTDAKDDKLAATAVNINGGIYNKTGGASKYHTGGFGMFQVSKHNVSVAANYATFNVKTTAGGLFAHNAASRGLTATFQYCTLIARSSDVVLFSSYCSSGSKLGGTVSFTNTVIDNFTVEPISAKPDFTFGAGCKINTPTDLSSLTATAQTLTASDGSQYTAKIGGAFVRSRNGYDYNTASGVTVKFLSKDGSTVLESAKWLLGEIPYYSGTPETKVVDGYTCTYGYVGVAATKSKTNPTYSPTLVNFGIPFLGKLSIDSNLHFTVYVPVKAAEAGDLAVNGKALAVPASTVYVSGNAYYTFEFAVVPAEALIPLSFTYTIAGESFTTEVSVLNYLKKLLDLDTSTIAARRVAYATVNYIAENVKAFNGSDTVSKAYLVSADALMRIYDAYAVTSEPKLDSADVKATANIKGAAFDLGEEAALLVYLSPSYVGDLTVTYTDESGILRILTVQNATFESIQKTTGSGTKTYQVARVYLPVADYLRNLTLTAGGGSVTYSLAAYLTGINKAEGEVPAYVLAFYSYAKAAALYNKIDIISVESVEEARLSAGPKKNSNPNGTSQFNPASALLTLALDVHHNGEDDESVTNLVRLLKSFVAGDGNEPCLDLGPHWLFAQISFGMGIARQTPLVWDKLDDATKERLDFFMSVLACLESFGTDDNNTYTTGPSGIGNYNKTWNPNYRMANVFPMIGVTIYFGSAEAVNEILRAFDYDTYIAKMQTYGFTNMYTYWTGMGVDKARTAMNNSSTRTWAYLTNGNASGSGFGVLRQGYTYHYMGHDLNDLAGIFEEIMSFTYSEIVTSDSSAMTNGNYTSTVTDSAGHTHEAGTPKAYIIDGTKSPVEGLVGMIAEFNGGDAGGIRSSAAYCDHDFILGVGAMAAVVEMGIWSPEDNPTLYNQIWVGNTDLIYKLQHGYMSYSKGACDGISYEGGYGGYYWMKSLWTTWLSKYHS